MDTWGRGAEEDKLKNYKVREKMTDLEILLVAELPLNYESQPAAIWVIASEMLFPFSIVLRKI